ncbi:unnamed protein product [Mycena citricolor]|uniref:Uncharacterized protein n=1 Tax=Mycena citricolor TaxID=2018698 RepID=A0AAD2H4N9_9AGAR|nr:unnamed protein product [Mycena citricolor]
MSFTRRSDQRTITIPSTVDEFTARYSETGTQSNLSFYDAFILPGQEKLTTSGSVVKAQALLAFRVVPMLGLHPRDVIPAWEKIPVSTDPDCRDMLNKLCAASSIDLGSVSLSRNNAENPELHNLIRLMQLERDVPDPFFPTPLDIDGATTFARKSMSQFITNPFLTVFLSLRDLRARRLAEHYEDVRDGASVATKSGVTGESDEDKNEVASEELLHRLMDIVLVYYSRKTKDQDWLRSTGAQLQLSCSFTCSPNDLEEFRRIPKPKENGRMEEEGPRQRSNSNPDDLESEANKQAVKQLERDKRANLDKASTNRVLSDLRVRPARLKLLRTDSRADQIHCQR